MIILLQKKKNHRKILKTSIGNCRKNEITVLEVQRLEIENERHWHSCSNQIYKSQVPKIMPRQYRGKG